MTITFWTNGDQDRPVSLCAPCPCGCDVRDHDYRPYLTASDEYGNGVTIRLEQEEIDRLKDEITRLA